MKKGTQVALWFYDEDGTELYAEVQYVGMSRQGEHQFQSIIYGWMYTVSKDLETVTGPNGTTYKSNTQRAWADCMKN